MSDSPSDSWYEPDYRTCRQCAEEDGVHMTHCELCDGDGCLTCGFTGRVEDEAFDWSAYRGLCPMHAQQARDDARAERED